jgi:hypothetical protein
VLEAVVFRLLEKDPGERYPQARALTVALDAAIEAMESDAARAADVPKTTPEARVPPRRVAAFAIALALGAGMVALVLAKGCHHEQHDVGGARLPSSVSSGSR